MWDSHGETQMYYGMYRIKKKLSGKRSIENSFLSYEF